MELFLWILVGFLFFNSLTDRKKVKQLQAMGKKVAENYKRRKSDVRFIERIGWK
ncbi:hypothetical protein Q7W32_10700 [Streptococcus suis]|nr:hypothetical protein [Streptococcus suis]